MHPGAFILDRLGTAQYSRFVEGVRRFAADTYGNACSNTNANVHTDTYTDTHANKHSQRLHGTGMGQYHRV